MSAQRDPETNSVPRPSGTDVRRARPLWATLLQMADTPTPTSPGGQADWEAHSAAIARTYEDLIRAGVADPQGRRLVDAARVAREARAREQRWLRIVPVLILTGSLFAAGYVETPLARRIFAALLGELQVPVTMLVTGTVVTGVPGVVCLVVGLYGGWRQRVAGRGTESFLNVGILGRALSGVSTLLWELMQPVLVAAVALLPAYGILALRYRDGHDAGIAWTLVAVAALLLHYAPKLVRYLDALTAATSRIPTRRWIGLALFGIMLLLGAGSTARSIPASLKCPRQVFMPSDVDAPATALSATQGAGSFIRNRAGGRGERTTSVSFVVDTNGRPEPRTIGALVPGAAAVTNELRAEVATLAFRAARKDDCPVRQLVVTGVADRGPAAPLR